jgi:hypothetical protein
VKTACAEAKSMRTWVAQVVLPILGALAALLGVLSLGRATRAALHDRDAYTIAWHDIDCTAPEGLSRGDFLAEVRSQSRLPERLHLLDADLADRLARAFAADPWVEAVRRIEVRPRPSLVRIELVHRKAVLAVCLSGSKIPSDGSALIETWSGMGRNALRPAGTVDANGILLPVAAVPSQMPVLTAEVAAPAGPPGVRWGDRRVAEAAATVGFLQTHLARLRLADCNIEIIEADLIFRKPSVRIVWGHAPGQEETGEAPAAVKLRRLLDYQARHGSLENLEHDVRLLTHEGHFPLSP